MSTYNLIHASYHYVKRRFPNNCIAPIIYKNAIQASRNSATPHHAQNMAYGAQYMVEYINMYEK